MAERHDQSPLVCIVVGSKSDWDVMQHAGSILDKFGIAHESRVLSAHRTPQMAAKYFANAEQRGVEVLICGAGAAAHLAGAAAGNTVLPVLGVPLSGSALNGLDALLSTVQMPAGIPVGTLAIGKAGAINAALLAIAILSSKRPDLREALRNHRAEMAEKVANESLE